MKFNLIKLIKRVFYFFVTKKFLLSIIVALLIYILAQNFVFGAQTYPYRSEYPPFPSDFSEYSYYVIFQYKSNSLYSLALTNSLPYVENNSIKFDTKVKRYDWDPNFSTSTTWINTAIYNNGATYSNIEGLPISDANNTKFIRYTSTNIKDTNDNLVFLTSDNDDLDYIYFIGNNNSTYYVPDILVSTTNGVIIKWYQNLPQLYILGSNSYFYDDNGIRLSGECYQYTINLARWELSEHIVNTQARLGYINEIIYNTTPIRSSSDYNNILLPSKPNFFYNEIEPYILDDVLSLATLSGNEITIDRGNLNLLDDNVNFYITTRPVGSSIVTPVFESFLNPSSDFYNPNGPNGAYYEIPISSFKDFLTTGYQVTYELSWITSDGQPYFSEISVIYDPTAETVDDITLLNDNINSNFNKINHYLGNWFNSLSTQQKEQFLQQYQLQQQQLNAQYEATEATKDTNQFLKNQNFDSSNLNLPQSNTTDITQDGVNNIFTMVYNAFTSGTPQDLIIPIPFTGKSITIPANFLQNILNQTSFSWVKNIIELFWWYIISVYIIKDIAKKMEKMKSGDIENLQNSNIKEDML